MEHLLPVIDRILKDLGITVKEVDALAVAVGPGSFTSLRVGLATAKALAHVLGKPLTGIPTLDALAQGLHGTSGLVCTVLPARAQEVYASFYTSSGTGMKRLSGYLALDPRQLVDRLRGELQAGITFTGEGAVTWWSLIREALGDRAILAEPAQIWPRAALIAFMGMAALQERRDDARQPAVRALYVKPPAIRRA